MPDEPIATLYIRDQSKQYRVKVFHELVWIERQPDGDNRSYGRSVLHVARDAYQDDVWDLQALATLFDLYESDVAGLKAL